MYAVRRRKCKIRVFANSCGVVYEKGNLDAANNHLISHKKYSTISTRGNVVDIQANTRSITPVSTKRRRRYKGRRKFFEYTFEPLLYLSQYERDVLEHRFAAERKGVPFFEKLTAWRRKGSWAFEVPCGVFGPRFGCTREQEAQALEDAARRGKLETGQLGFRRSQGLREFRGLLYLNESALEALRSRARIPEFITAMLHFLRAAKENPALIQGPPRETAWSPKQRERKNGRHIRGPTWKEWEDYVLRRWFGRWPDGRHHKLTDQQWENILERELKGRRTKKMVKQRMVVLNHQLKVSLMIDGVITRDGVREYMAKALGERIQVPKFRPRLHGDYRKPAPPNGGNVVNPVTHANPANEADEANKGN